MKLSTGKAKPCPWGGIALCTSKSWGQPAGKQLCREEPGGPGGQKVTMNQQNLMAAEISITLGCISRSAASPLPFAACAP